MAHVRKRSGTLSSLITPPTPLREGQSKRLKLWISDENPDRVVLNHEIWPGVAVGDVIQVHSAVPRKDDDGLPGKSFCFVVGKDEGARYGSLQQITVPKHLATVFGFQNRSEVILTKVNKESVTADAVEIHFRDQYLGRCDMWRLEESLEEQCIHHEEKVMFAGCISATVKAIHVKGKKVSSAYITSRTKMIFRSNSAKTTIFIQVCRELWDFADDGERYYEKICHFFLPALIARWQALNTTHVVTIVLISRVFYQDSEKEYAAGPIRKDPDSSQWYKDFYKVIVDLEVVHDWKPSLVYLKESFWTFQRDILLTHHYHRNVHQPRQQDDGPLDDTPVRLVGRIGMAHEGPILEALNLSLNPMESHYVDRSLVLTGCSMILISPGTGHFRVNKRLLQLTTTRMLDQGFGLDLVCMSKAPLHRSPVFSFWGAEPGTNDSIPGIRDTDPLWVYEKEDGPIPGVGINIARGPPQVKKYLYWEPFWVSLSFWDQQNNMPFREDRFIPRARMYEIQMLGLLAHDVSTLAIPYLQDKEGVHLPDDVVPEDAQSRQTAIKAMRDQFDSDVFAMKGKKEKPPVALSRGPSTSSSGGFRSGMPPPPVGRPPSPASRDIRPPIKHTISDERPTLSAVSSTSSIATTVATYATTEPKKKSTKPAPLMLEKTSSSTSEESTRSPDPGTPTQPRSQSPSQLSVKSTSTSSTKESRRRASRAGALSSKFGVGTWLYNSLTGRSGPSQAEASQVSIGRIEVGRTAVATPTTAVTNVTIPTTGSSEKSKEVSPIKPAPQPITIKGGSIRRSTTTVRAEESKQALGRPRSYASPVSSSPGQDSAMLAAFTTTTTATRRPPTTMDAVVTQAINPSRPLSILSHAQSSLARRWQHIFATPTLQQQIKWKSMCTPACLPLTTEYYPSKTELEKAYQVYSYDVLVTPEVHASFMLKRTAGKTDDEEEWPLLVMRQMAALRLALGFQFIVAPTSLALAGTNSRPQTSGMETAISTRFGPGVGPGGRYTTPTHPVGASEFFKSINDHAYLSMSNQIHRISFDPAEQVIQVARYVRRTTWSMEPVQYGALVWPRLGDGYREVSATFAYPNLDMYGWNRMDMLVAGYEHDLAESLRYWRTRFVVIPTEHPPTFNQISGEKLSDEEIRLLGADKLAELFHRARWYKPNEKPEDTQPTRFLPTTLEPAVCLMDETLLAQLDKIHEQGPLKIKSNSNKSVGETQLTVLAAAMREADGVATGDHIWHRNCYSDSFTGYEFVSWLVREYRDVPTREQGAEWGSRLMEQGLLEHCRGAHGFMDGHYYYRLTEEYRDIKPNKGPRWFRPPMPNVKGVDEALMTSTANLEAVAMRAGLTPVATPSRAGAAFPRKSKRQLILSQTMIIAVDSGGRSKYAETAILHHDIIHNPGTAFHFELNWMGTTARFIDDMMQQWGRSIEKYGLRLVEAYVDPIVNIKDKNVFQSTFPIRLALLPPEIPNLARRLPEGTRPEHYFEYAILRHFDYILDIEAGSRYSDTVDVCYSYRRSSFKYSQFVHKSGLAFVQVIGGTEGFQWLTNRLAGTSNHSLHGMAAAAATAPGTEKERLATSELINRQLKGLSEFCSDPVKLQAFYSLTAAKLPAEDVEET